MAGMNLPVAWYAGGLAAAVVIGWLAAMLHLMGIAPVGILSLGVGAALGAAAGGWAIRRRMTCPTRLVIGTLVMACITVLVEHAWLYREFCRQWQTARANSAEVAMFRPEAPWSPSEYFTREATSGRIMYWVLDATLIAAAGVATAIAVRRRVAATCVAATCAASDAANPDP